MQEEAANNWILELALECKHASLAGLDDETNVAEEQLHPSNLEQKAFASMFPIASSGWQENVPPSSFVSTSKPHKFSSNGWKVVVLRDPSQCTLFFLSLYQGAWKMCDCDDASQGKEGQISQRQDGMYLLLHSLLAADKTETTTNQVTNSENYFYKYFKKRNFCFSVSSHPSYFASC